MSDNPTARSVLKCSLDVVSQYQNTNRRSKNPASAQIVFYFLAAQEFSAFMGISDGKLEPRQPDRNSDCPRISATHR